MDDDTSKEYLAYRDALYEREFRDMVVESYGTGGQPVDPSTGKPLQGNPLAIPDMARRERPPGSLSPESGGQAASQAITGGAMGAIKGAAKGLVGLPKDTLQSVEDLSNWIQGSDIHLVEDYVPGPDPSPQGSVESFTRAVTGFAAAFALSSGIAGAAMKGSGLSASAPKLAALVHSAFGTGAAAYITDTSGYSQNLPGWAASQLPDGLRIPFADLLESDPSDPAAVRRFKGAVGVMLDQQALGAMLSIAKIVHGIEGGMPGGGFIGKAGRGRMSSQRGSVGPPSPDLPAIPQPSGVANPNVPWLAGLKDVGGQLHLRFESRGGGRIPSADEVRTLFPNHEISIEQLKTFDPKGKAFIVTFWDAQNRIDYAASRKAAEAMGGEFFAEIGGPGGRRFNLGPPPEK